LGLCDHRGGAVLIALDSLVVITALPVIKRDLGASLSAWSGP